jgi:hypothetical protein
MHVWVDGGDMHGWPLLIDYAILRTATPKCGGDTHQFDKKQKDLHSFFLSLREMSNRKRHSRMLCDTIDENALAKHSARWTFDEANLAMFKEASKVATAFKV